MSTLELEHLKHSGSSSNNLSVHSDGSLTLGNLQSLNVDSGTLYVDTTNNRVGVGRTDPADALSVNGDIRLQNGQPKSRLIYFNNTGPYTLNSSGGAAIGFHNITGHQEIFFETHHGGVAHRETGRITKEGYHVKPYQPAAFAYKAGTGNQAASVTGTGVFDTAGSNVGNHFSTSTGRFTCPLAGRYFVTWTCMNHQSNTGTVTAKFRWNGAAYKYFHVENAHPQGQSDQVIVNAAANDYFDLDISNFHWNGGSQFKYPSMCVFFIG